MDTTIKELFEASQRRSGSPKITRELTKRGWRVSKNRVPRRMRLPGLRSIARRRFRVTTNSKHRYPVAPDRLQRNFTAQRPNQVWVSDITYLRVGCGWLYLAVLIDLHSPRVVGTTYHSTNSSSTHPQSPLEGVRFSGGVSVLHSVTVVIYYISGIDRYCIRLREA